MAQATASARSRPPTNYLAWSLLERGSTVCQPHRNARSRWLSPNCLIEPPQLVSPQITIGSTYQPGALSPPCGLDTPLASALAPAQMYQRCSPGLPASPDSTSNGNGGARGMGIPDSDPAVDLDPDNEPNDIKRLQRFTFAPALLSGESPEASSHHGLDRSLWFTHISLM